MWPKHYNNLCAVERYHYFRQSCRSYNIGAYEAVIHHHSDNDNNNDNDNGNNSSDSDSDNEDSWQLTATKRMLIELHENYFTNIYKTKIDDNNHNNLNNGSNKNNDKSKNNFKSHTGNDSDVRIIMRHRRSKVLSGTTVLFMYAHRYEHTMMIMKQRNVNNDSHSNDNDNDNNNKNDQNDSERIMRHPLCELVKNLGGVCEAVTCESVRKHIRINNDNNNNKNQSHIRDNDDDNSDNTSGTATTPAVIVLLPHGNGTEGRFSNSFLLKNRFDNYYYSQLDNYENYESNNDNNKNNSEKDNDNDTDSDTLHSLLRQAKAQQIPIVRSQWIHRCFYALSREDPMKYQCDNDSGNNNSNVVITNLQH